LRAELREARDQETAAAEVLQVINASPGDLAPVFDAILEKAHSLCGVARGSLELYDGQNFRAVATRGVADSLADELRQGYPASDNPATRPLIEGQAFTHILDRTQHKFPFTGGAVDAEVVHTLLCIPLRRDDKVLGMITAARLEVRPFSDKQIALLQNFAAQAVIAMENARLITETQEALEQQTATAEVLQVINASPGDLAPVFDAMVERAMRLCEADEAAVRTFDGQVLHLVAAHGEPETTEQLRQLGPSHVNGLYEPLAHGESVIHIADVRETDAFREVPRARERLEVRGIRSWLAVALRKDGALLGVINVHRREVIPFTERQIAVLQSFAAQAVIAIENARLITETREALDQQTATAEVLGVINSSPGDLGPVFDAILEKAHRLCGAAFGALLTYDGDRFRAVALQGLPPALAEIVRQGFLPSPNNPIGRLLAGEPLVHIDDLKVIADAAPEESMPRAAVDLGVIRTLLMVPLRKDDTLLDVITAYRQKVQPFSDKQIALLQNFAAQAVIAMENAAHYRNERGPGAADRHSRSLGRHKFLARRPCPGVRHDLGEGAYTVRGGAWLAHDL
jgi:GAF domain-containing protein